MPGDIAVYNRCLREKNRLVRQKKKPQNEATYAPCRKYRPGGPKVSGYDSCVEIYRLEIEDGAFRLPGKHTLKSYCRYRMSLVHPPKQTVWDWVDNAAKTAGRAVGDVASTAGKGFAIVGDALDQIPIVGPALSASFSLANAPYLLAADVLSGVRIDKAAMRNLERQVGNIQKVAPYVQTVIGFVPGVGPLASGAIAAGLTLAQGQPIDKALLSFAKGAIPGGPIAQMAFEIGQGVLSGKPLEQIAISALPVPAQAKKLLAQGAELTRAIASGKPVDKALIEQAVALIPPGPAQNLARAVASGKPVEQIALDAALGAVPGAAKTLAQKAGVSTVADLVLKQAEKSVPPGLQKHFNTALSTGMALGQAEKLQKIATKNIQGNAFVEKMRDKAEVLIKKDPVLAAAYKLAPKDGLKGFELGAAMMTQRVGITDLLAARKMLSPADAKSFDLATSLQIGRVTRPTPAGLLLPGNQAGYFLTQGMRGASPEMKVAMMKEIAEDPLAKVGAVVAIKQVAEERKSWLDHLLEALGLGPSAPQVAA